MVVAHAGVGTALAASRSASARCSCRAGYRRGEHVDDHQIQIAAELGGRGLAVSTDADELGFEDLQRAAEIEVRRLSDPPPLETDA